MGNDVVDCFFGEVVDRGNKLRVGEVAQRVERTGVQRTIEGAIETEAFDISPFIFHMDGQAHNLRALFFSATLYYSPTLKLFNRPK